MSTEAKRLLPAANLWGVPELASEDEIRWCFRKWDLPEIKFHPTNVVINFESAADLSAALVPTNAFIVRGQTISIEGIYDFKKN